MVSQNEHPQSFKRLIDELAVLYGVLPRYRDSRGRWRDSPPSSIYQALRALGAALDVEPDAAVAAGGGAAEGRLLERAAARRKEETWSRLIEPTIVLWEGSPGSLGLRLPPGGPAHVDMTLTLEGGEEKRRRLDLASLDAVGRERCGRRSYTAY